VLAPWPLPPPTPQWDASVEVVRGKHVKAAAAERLGNMVSPSSIDASDVRHASLRRAASAGAPFDALHARDAAFTRGDCTTGWEHSTSIGRFQLARSLVQLDSKVEKAGPRRARSLPRARPTLVQRQAAAAGAARATKQRAARQRREWAAAFGPEGAAAMEAAAAAAAARAACAGAGTGAGGSTGHGGGHAGDANGAAAAASTALQERGQRQRPAAPPRGPRARAWLVSDIHGVMTLPDLGLLPSGD
jgi:hypothetical protein